MKLISWLEQNLLTAAAAAIAFCSTATADDALVKHADKSFIQNAYKDGLGEVKLGELAQQKTAHADVKTLATKIVADHQKTNAEAKALADSKKVSVAKDEGVGTDARHKMLDAKSGGDFDKAFIEAVVKHHKAHIKAFEKAASESGDADVKAFATKTLPGLKLHLSMAEGVWDKLGR